MALKKCPYCAEEIQAEAIKCKHCGEMLNKAELPAVEVVPTPVVVDQLKQIEAATKQGTNKILLWFILVPLLGYLAYILLMNMAR